MDDTYQDLTGHVLVCGLSNLALRVVEQLHRAGERVVIADDVADAKLVRIVRDWGVTMLAGDPRMTGVLHRCGIDGAVSVICVEEDDLHNLETALLVRDLRADVRLVVHLTNVSVGHAVSRLQGPVTVLDAAGLAAPAFAEVCLGLDEHALQLGGVPFVVAHRTAPKAGKLRHLFGDLAPLAVVPADGGEMAVCPGRDLVVHDGDTVVVLGTEDELAEIRAVAETEIGPARGRGHSAGQSLRRTASLFASVPREMERPLRVTLAALFIVAALSVIALAGSYKNADGSRMSILDAIYFTIETIATVGFGDFSFAAQDVWLRVWAIILMLFGFVLVTFIAALLTNMLVSRRIAESLGRKEVTGMQDHVIVVGLGALGIRVVEALHYAGRRVVVVEADESNRHLGNVRAMKVPVLVADSTLHQTLHAVNLNEATAVAVLTSNDLTNIETALAVADELGGRNDTVPVVLRVFDRQLAGRIERSFGFRHVRSTAALAAPWFVGAALGLDVLGSFYVEDQPFLIGRITVGEGGGLDGVAMHELSMRTRVVAIQRAASPDSLEHPPRRDTRFAAGDSAFLVGPYEDLIEVLHREAARPSAALLSTDLSAPLTHPPVST